MSRLRVVLDANVLAPGLLAAGSSSAEIIRYWQAGVFDLLISGKLIGEVAETLMALGLSNDAIEELVAILCVDVDNIIPIKHQTFGLDDPNDDYIIETLIEGNGSIIVTRDKGFSDLSPQLRRMLAIRHARIMSDVDFLDYLRNHIFSPLIISRRGIVFADIVGPIEEVPCVVCGHGFHWGFTCGETYSDSVGEPWMCECPAKVGLQPA
jgi:putative PIN family toxin of toxin-antitoxin system